MRGASISSVPDRFPTRRVRQDSSVTVPAALVDQTFSVPAWLDLASIAVGALQGALFAAEYKDRRLDILGIAIIGTAVGLGGGLMRDILLGVMPAAIHNQWYLVTALMAALVGMLLQQVFHRVKVVITVLDAFTLGLFCAIGTTKALSFGVSPVPAIFIGVAAAVGGGVLRDMLMNLSIAVMYVSSFYAIAAVVGSVVLVLLASLGVNIAASAIACIVVTFVLRLLAVRYGWSLPEQRSLSRASIRRWRWPTR